MPGWRSPNVFISYRRDDSAVHTRTIHDGLVAGLDGDEHVFMDVADLAYGDAFFERIQRTLAASDVVVVVIGPQWQRIAGPDGVPRLLRADDTVRYEVASALAQGKRVIPVFVGGAGGLDKPALPPDLQRLADLNGLVFTDRQLGEGVDRLLDAVRGRRAADIVTRTMRLRLAQLTGLAIALTMISAAWVGLFDLLSLDTRAATYTMALADTVAPVEPPAQLRWIAVDMDTERAMGKAFRRNPAARAEHARLIRRLTQAGARSIAFDLFIVAPSPPNDVQLVAAVREARARGVNVVFGANRVESGQPLMLPVLREAIGAWAMLCYGQRLGYAHAVPLASGGPGDAQARAVGLALAAAFPGAAQFSSRGRQVLVAGPAGVHEVAYSDLETLDDSQPCHVGRPGDSIATALYRASPLSVLRGERHRDKFESVLAMEDAALAERYRGATVLVGLAMPDDDVYTSFYRWRAERRHGLELHADAAGALLAGRIVQPLPGWLQFVSMIGVGLGGARLALAFDGWPRWRRRLLLLAALGGCVLLATALCAGAGLLLSLPYVLGTLLLGWVLAGRYRPRTRAGD